MHKFILLVAWCGAAVFANAESFVRPNPTSSGSWYEGAVYAPKSIRIRGIPVKALDREWCAADELRIGDFPPKIAKEMTAHAKEAGWNFQHENFPFAHLHSVTALVGVAKKCGTNKTTFFILLLDNKEKGEKSLLFVQPFENELKLGLKVHDKDTIWIGFCENCDDITGLRLKKTGFFWVDPFADEAESETPVKKKK
jgi:hypothetical protein